MPKFTDLDANTRNRLIEFLAEGNTIEELAEQLLETMSEKEIEELVKEESQW